MENLGVGDSWKGRRVLVTGHTGFKGSWLSLWLLESGASVYGLALEPQGPSSLFNQLQLSNSLDHAICDLRDFEGVKERVDEVDPEFVFHLAAQPLVLKSYVDPLATWNVNLLGSLHLLEALRLLGSPCAVVMITTDKVYENRGVNHFYSEGDRLGGFDPYSCSKVALEIAVESWRKACDFTGKRKGIRIAVARAGNVIGGGDWGADRLVPDIVRALLANQVVELRNPDSIRPWQHVLDVLSGYLLLAEMLSSSDGRRYEEAWNFGPEPTEIRTVRELAEAILEIWPGIWRETGPTCSNGQHEAEFLALSIKKAQEEFGFTPRWNFSESVRRTVEWYRCVSNGTDALEMAREQLSAYLAA